MERSMCLIFPLIFLILSPSLLTLASAEKGKDSIKAKSMGEETPRGGGGGVGYYPGDQHGVSQQYHYSAYPSHHGGHGFPFDTTTVAIFVFLILGAMCFPFFSGYGYGGAGYGRKSFGGETTADASEAYDWSSRSINLSNLTGTAEKVLNAVEKLYAAYGKAQ